MKHRVARIAPRRAAVGYARIVPLAATFAAACVLALVAAYWGWQLAGPAPAYVVTPEPADPAARVVAAHLFGRAGADVHDAPSAADLPPDTRLLGIVASTNGRSYALFRLPGGPRVVEAGQDIASGVRLVAIAPDAITLRDARGERRFALRSVGVETKHGGASSPPRLVDTATTPVRTTNASAACAPPPGFHGNVIRLNTELLGGLTGDAGPWRALLAATDSGLVVRDGNGFGAMLGLQAGDRIVQANGIALHVPDDVAGAVIRPLVANQGVRIVGSRRGTRQELWLANVACAG